MKDNEENVSDLICPEPATGMLVLSCSVRNQNPMLLRLCLPWLGGFIVEKKALINCSIYEVKQQPCPPPLPRNRILIVRFHLVVRVDPAHVLVVGGNNWWAGNCFEMFHPWLFFRPQVDQLGEQE